MRRAAMKRKSGYETTANEYGQIYARLIGKPLLRIASAGGAAKGCMRTARGLAPGSRSKCRFGSRLALSLDRAPKEARAFLTLIGGATLVGPAYRSVAGDHVVSVPTTILKVNEAAEGEIIKNQIIGRGLEARLATAPKIGIIAAIFACTRRFVVARTR
jgi:hypothetical protein